MHAGLALTLLVAACAAALGALHAAMVQVGGLVAFWLESGAALVLAAFLWGAGVLGRHAALRRPGR